MKNKRILKILMLPIGCILLIIYWTTGIMFIGILGYTALSMGLFLLPTVRNQSNKEIPQDTSKEADRN